MVLSDEATVSVLLSPRLSIKMYCRENVAKMRSKRQRPLVYFAILEKCDCNERQLCLYYSVTIGELSRQALASLRNACFGPVHARLQ